MRGGKRRGIVDAVAGQQHPETLSFHPIHGVGLVLWQEAGAHVVDADLRGQPPRGALVVPGQQHRSGSGNGSDASDGGCGGRTGAVSGAEQRDRGAVEQDDGRGLAAVLQNRDLGGYSAGGLCA